MPEVTEQVQGKGKGIKREDPPPRPVEQVANRGYLEGADPRKHFVYVSEVNDPTINVGYYLSRGYKISQFDPDEAKPTVGYNEYKQGDPIKAMGMVLMEAPVEHKQQLDAVGWKKADEIQETIRKRDIDPLSPSEAAQFRGITSTRMENDDRRKWQF